MRRTRIKIKRESLRLCRDTDLSQREVAASLGVSHSTVCRALQRAAVAGLSAEDAAGVTDSELHAALHPGPDVRLRSSGGRLMPDWDSIEMELTRERKPREVKETRRHLWKEYRTAAKEGGQEAYSYSQFCSLLAEGSDGPSAKVAMRFAYEPGVWGMADFSGKTLRLRLPDGGEKPVEMFVACLCLSRLIYVEAVADHSARSWCMAHRWAFENSGGVPQRHRIDGLKAGVIRVGREDFVLTEQFRDLARHYGVAVLPAPPRAGARQGNGRRGREGGSDGRSAGAAGCGVLQHGGDEPSHRGRVGEPQRAADAGLGREPARAVRGAGEGCLAAVAARALGMARMAEAAHGRAERPYPCGQELLFGSAGLAWPSGGSPPLGADA